MERVCWRCFLAVARMIAVVDDDIIVLMMILLGLSDDTVSNSSFQRYLEDEFVLFIV